MGHNLNYIITVHARTQTGNTVLRNQKKNSNWIKWLWNCRKTSSCARMSHLCWAKQSNHCLFLNWFLKMIFFYQCNCFSLSVRCSHKPLQSPHSNSTWKNTYCSHNENWSCSHLLALSIQYSFSARKQNKTNKKIKKITFITLCWAMTEKSALPCMHTFCLLLFIQAIPFPNKKIIMIGISHFR